MTHWDFPNVLILSWMFIVHPTRKSDETHPTRGEKTIFEKQLPSNRTVISGRLRTVKCFVVNFSLTKGKS